VLFLACQGLQGMLANKNRTGSSCHTAVDGRLGHEIPTGINHLGRNRALGGPSAARCCVQPAPAVVAVARRHRRPLRRRRAAGRGCAQHQQPAAMACHVQYTMMAAKGCIKQLEGIKGKQAV
jgi:hypothetical protein